MLYYDLINEKDGVDYSEMKDMVKTTNVAIFITLLHKTLKEVNTTAMGVFSARYTSKTAKDY